MKEITDIQITEEQPHDRMTALCAEMTDTLEKRDDSENIRSIVLLQEGENGGIQLGNYESIDQAIDDLTLHLKVLLKGEGKTLGSILDQ